MADDSANRRSGLLTWIAWIGVGGSLLLLPVRSFELPLNTEPVDLWNFVALPLLWLYLIASRPPIRLPYALPMWLILFTSLVATWGAESPTRSLTVLMKELYLYSWLLTTAAVLNRFAPQMTRRLLILWSVVAAAHALLIIAQFVSPAILNATAFSGGETVYRPPGLFKNSNGTAVYQVMAFVPLYCARLNPVVTATCGTLYVLSVIATGSLSGFSAIVVGGAVLMALSLLVKRPVLQKRRIPAPAILLALIAAIAGAIFLHNPENHDKLEHLFYGRAERSSSSRMILWVQAKELIESDSPLWGIGPNNFADTQFGGQSLHNDMIAFVVERGLLGALGLVCFVSLALAKSAFELFRHKDDLVLTKDTIVFFAAICALAIPSLTHQIFHARSLWLVLALQEVFVVLPARARRREMPVPASRQIPPHAIASHRMS